MSPTIQQLPLGWTRARLDEVGDVVLGQSPPGSTYNINGEGLPFFQGKAEFGDYYPTPVKWCTAPTKLAGPEDVLISVRAPVGPTNICPSKACIGRGLAAIRPRHGIPSRYVLYALRASAAALREKATGTTFEAVSGSELRSHVIPVAPPDEQHRIVAEIEKQFTRLEAGVAALWRVQANLKRYHAAVLKAACEGRLVPTEAELARQEKRSYDTGEALVVRILDERRRKWTGRGLYKEPASPDATALPRLREGWTWVELGQLAWSVKDGPHYSPKYVSDGIPFISGGNVRPSGIDFAGAKRISPTLHAELSRRCKPEFGDLLYTKGGTTGIARVNTYHDEFNVWVHVAVIKLADSVDRFYLQHTLNSPFCYAQARKFTHGVGNQDLGLTRMIHIALPLPPLAEQQRIVAEVERRLSVIEELESAVTANLQRAARLRQSILERAFSGRLVNALD